MDDAEFDTDKIDDAVLALMYLGLHDEQRSWKSIGRRRFACMPRGLSPILSARRNRSC
jgi:hypothetical protein